jgi:hypothetical protein
MKKRDLHWLLVHSKVEALDLVMAFLLAELQGSVGSVLYGKR